jgi:hypothetical protein
MIKVHFLKCNNCQSIRNTSFYRESSLLNPNLLKPTHQSGLIDRLLRLIHLSFWSVNFCGLTVFLRKRDEFLYNRVPSIDRLTGNHQGSITLSKQQVCYDRFFGILTIGFVALILSSKNGLSESSPFHLLSCLPCCISGKIHAIPIHRV